MIFARIAVAGAILCTLWFNASYAWGKATDLPGQVNLRWILFDHHQPRDHYCHGTGHGRCACSRADRP